MDTAGNGPAVLDAKRTGGRAPDAANADRPVPRSGTVTSATSAQAHMPPGTQHEFASLALELKELLGHVLATVGGRTRVASYPDLPGGLLAMLARDEAFEVRRAVARNPGTPGDVLRGLAEEWACRFALGANPGAPPELLARLTREWDPAIRRAVARNPAAPTVALSGLARDADPRVRSAATRTLRGREGLNAAPLRAGSDASRDACPRARPSLSPQGPSASGAATTTEARPPARLASAARGCPGRGRTRATSPQARVVWRHIARLLG